MLDGKWVLAVDNLKKFLTGSYVKPKEKKRISLRGITNGNNLTNEDFEKAKVIWKSTRSP